jgi:molybdate/tungstate transport system permease protein
MRRTEPFFWCMLACGVLVGGYILLPLVELMTSSSAVDLRKSLQDADVLRSIRLSIVTAGSAAGIAFVLGTPLAYLLARYDFKGKRFLDAVIDLPIVVPHPVVGIAFLGIAGRNHWIGQMLHDIGLRLMGSTAGIIAVLTFVGMPFYVHSAKTGFEAVSPRLEKISRSLGASMAGTFVRITLPLSWRSLLSGIIMCGARAISEFGAVVVVAYHPMTAPVLIYERFEGYGLKYSQPVAVWLVSLCLGLFFLLRVLALRKPTET